MENAKNSNIIVIFKGIVLSMISTLILLFIFATILTYTDVSENTIMPVIIMVTCVSILIGSSIATHKIKKMGLLNGGVIGGIYISLLYIISSIINTGFSLDINSIIMISFGILSGTIGGIVGVNRK